MSNAERIDAATVAALQGELRGELLRPGDRGFEDARRVHNGMIDRHPALIARPADAADVAACVNFARENDLLLAVRGGGHSGAGMGVCDGGLVIDLSAMQAIRVDPAAATVRVEGGCTWGKVDQATNAFGLAVPSGIIATTGVGGLALGGGHGYLTRRFGLTVDHLLAADVVLADGRLVTADAATNPDLFWALRGGGGNFGVVTSFLFRARPVETVLGGITMWRPEQAGEAMRTYRDHILAMPEDVYGFFMFATVPPAPPFPAALHGQTVCGVVWCCTAPAEKAEAATRPVRSFGPPVLDFLQPMPFPAMQSLFDPLYPPGLQWYWRGDFFNALSDEAITLHARHGPRLPTPLSTMHVYPIDGAAHRVGGGDTAFSYRDANFSAVYVGVDPDPANAGRITAWAKEYHEALHPHSAGGAYVNFMMDEGQERVRATYRDSYDRLAAVKAEYDPGNLFRVNQNIRPARLAAAAGTRA